MTVPDGANEVVQDQTPVAGNEPLTQESGTDNPIYAQYVQEFPAGLHGVAENIFKKWDADTSKRFEAVHSQYEPLKPYERFANEKVEADALAQAWDIRQRIEQDPQAVYQMLGEALGLNGKESGQGQPEASGDEESGEFDPLLADPRFAQVEQLTRATAEFVASQEQARRDAELDRQIDTEINGLRATRGYSDEDLTVVLGLMVQGMTAEQAATAYDKGVEAALQRKSAPPAPVVLGGGGGVPTEPVIPSKMTSQERKAMIAQMARQNAESGR